MIRRITSKDNFIIKRMKQLEARKYRDRFEQFVLEGPTVIEEAFTEKIKLSFAVYCDGFMKAEGAKLIIDRLLEEKVPVYSVDGGMFAYISGTETPQGILAVAEKPKWEISVLEEPGTNYIVLDQLADPGNIGTIIRTAEAAGFRGLLVLKGTADPYSGKVSRAAAGALMRVPVLYIDTPEELIGLMKKCGKKTLCTSPRSSQYYYDIDMWEDTAIIIGNEASGIREELLKSADLTVGIPMEGKTESLNAAVAGCILMYESLRQKNMQKKVLQK